MDLRIGAGRNAWGESVQVAARLHQFLQQKQSLKFVRIDQDWPWIENSV